MESNEGMNNICGFQHTFTRVSVVIYSGKRAPFSPDQSVHTNRLNDKLEALSPNCPISHRLLEHHHKATTDSLCYNTHP